MYAFRYKNWGPMTRVEQERSLGTHLKFSLLHLVIKHGILSYSSPACHRPCSNFQVATGLLTIVCVTPCLLQPSEATKLTLLLCTCRLCLLGSEAVRYLIALISIRLRLYQCCPTFLTPRAAQDIIMKPRAAPVNSKVTAKICSTLIYCICVIVIW